MTTVHVLGSLNADQGIRVTALPLPGETVLGSDISIAVGGKGANQAIAAANAGARVAMVGAVGDDDHGRFLRAALLDYGVDAGGVRASAGVTTGLAIVAVDADGENAIMVSPGANATLDRDDVAQGLTGLEAGDLLVLQLEIPAPVAAAAARYARRRGARVLLNAAPAPTEASGLLDDVDILVVNEHELAAISRLHGLRADGREPRMRELASLHNLTVVCTAGAEGAYAIANGRGVHVAAPVVRAVDTTGAGDTFVGFLAAALLRDAADLPGAMASAVRASALSVTRYGAAPSIPFGHEVFSVAEDMTIP